MSGESSWTAAGFGSGPAELGSPDQLGASRGLTVAQRPIVMNGTRLAVNDDGSLAVANADGSPIAGGSTTVGNVAVATAAAPTYVEGATVPLSVDLAGTLRSTAGSGGGTSGPVDVTDRTARLLGHTQVDNFPATQAVSAASLPLPSGAATEASLGTDGASSPAIPGTGVRGWLRSIYDLLAGTLTANVSDRAARLLGHVTVDNSTLTVTGTFWQTTQPVSGPLTDTQLRANAVPVSGPLTDTQLRASVVAVDVTPAAPVANDYLPVRLTDGAAFYAATGAGGGGGAATIADGADVAQGTTTDTAWTTGAGTVVGLLKAAVNAIKGTLTADITDRAARLLGHVTVDNASIPVTGTFWQATQPVSGTVTANLGTVDGLALDATLTGGTQRAIPRGAAKGTTAAGDVTSAAVDANTQAMHVQLTGTQPTVPVSGTFWQATQPVSGTFWQATQPVSGTVTANQGGSPWTIQGQQSALTTGAITTATTVVSMSVTNTNIVTVGVFGTYAGVSFVFEASMDNTNWFSMQGTRTDAFVTENGATTLTNTTRAWDVPIGFFTNFRVRATAWTSGTANIVMGAQAMPYEPSPNVGIQAVGGTAVTSTVPVSGTVNASLFQIANTTGIATALRTYNALTVVLSPNLQSAYMASTAGTVAIPTTLSTTTSLAYLFHGSGVTLRYEITRIEIDVEGPTTASTAGQVTTLRLNKITAENGTPGGTSQTILGLDGADGVSGGVFRTGATGAPTRTTGDVSTWQIQTVATNQHQVFVWSAEQHNQGKGLVCRGSTAEGWEIRAVTNGTAIGAAVNVAITYYWKELP